MQIVIAHAILRTSCSRKLHRIHKRFLHFVEYDHPEKQYDYHKDTTVSKAAYGEGAFTIQGIPETFHDRG